MNSEAQFSRQALDTCLALTPLLFMGVYFYGPRVLILTLISILTALVTDYLCLLMQGERRFRKGDFSAFVTGYLFAMLLPASAPYWLVIVGAVFAMAVVRHPFGGHYNTMFNPALTAFAFVTICWTDVVTSYPAPRTVLPLSATVENVALSTSPAYRLMHGGAENIDFLNALLGNFYGPLGATSILVLLCCGIFLIVRKTIIWQIPVATLGIVALFSLILPRVNASRPTSLILELISGVLLFSVLFVASMDNGELQTTSGKWVYGIILGLFVVLFRHISKIELVTPFAIIIMNAIDHKCDDYAVNIVRYGGAFCEDAWLLLKWLGQKIGSFFVFLWDKLFALFQKVIDK